MPSGINSAGDIVQSAIDGASLGTNGDLWEELRAALKLQNDAKDNLRAMFTYPTVRATEEVAQVTSADDFEDASEYGVPRSLRAKPELMVMGFNFTWRDLASLFSWEFLADATADQIRNAADLAFTADTRQIFNSVMGCLFNPTTRMNKEGTFVYPLYNGDAWVPPEYHNETPLAPHTHYLTTGAATVDGEDLVGLMTHIQHHGYADGLSWPTCGP